MTHPTLAACDLRAGYGPRAVLDGVSIEIPQGGITALVGPNGSGKSTLLKALARLLAPQGGAALLDGEAIRDLPTATVARRLAILPQAPSAPGTFTIRELVEQGRYPHVGALRMLRRQDHEAVREALALTGLEAFAHRPIDALSGGERQRAWIALALAQATPVLLLDEPTTYLDIAHQMEVLDLVAELQRTRGLTVIMVLHDLNQAARYADRMVVMQAGRIVADGPPDEVFEPGMLARVFRIQARMLVDPVTGGRICVPCGLAKEPASLAAE